MSTSYIKKASYKWYGHKTCMHTMGHGCHSEGLSHPAAVLAGGGGSLPPRQLHPFPRLVLSVALALVDVGQAIKLVLITACIFGNWVESFALLNLVPYFLQTVSPSSSATFWLWLFKQLAIYEAFWCFRQRIWKSKGNHHPLWTMSPQRELALLCVVVKFINNSEHYIHLAGKSDIVFCRSFCCHHEPEKTVLS